MPEGTKGDPAWVPRPARRVPRWSELRRNRRAFRDVEFVPRVLRDVSTVGLGATVLGVRYEAPFGIAPTGPPG